MTPDTPNAKHARRGSLFSSIGIEERLRFKNACLFGTSRNHDRSHGFSYVHCRNGSKVVRLGKHAAPGYQWVMAFHPRSSAIAIQRLACKAPPKRTSTQASSYALSVISILLTMQIISSFPDRALALGSSVDLVGNWQDDKGRIFAVQQVGSKIKMVWPSKSGPPSVFEGVVTGPSFILPGTSGMIEGGGTIPPDVEAQVKARGESRPARVLCVIQGKRLQVTMLSDRVYWYHNTHKLAYVVPDDYKAGPYELTRVGLGTDPDVLSAIKTVKDDGLARYQPYTDPKGQVVTRCSEFLRNVANVFFKDPVEALAGQASDQIKALETLAGQNRSGWTKLGSASDAQLQAQSTFVIAVWKNPKPTVTDTGHVAIVLGDPGPMMVAQAGTKYVNSYCDNSGVDLHIKYTCAFGSDKRPDVEFFAYRTP